MIEVEFCDGVKATVHLRTWECPDRSRLDLCRAVSENALSVAGYKLDADLFVAEAARRNRPAALSSVFQNSFHLWGSSVEMIRRMELSSLTNNA